MSKKNPEEVQQDKDQAAREALREKTHKKGKWAYYRVGNQGAYCQGVTYQPGDTIRRPVDILPSLNWTAVTDETGTPLEGEAKSEAPAADEAEAAKPAAKKAAKPAAKKRPSDTE